MRTFSGKLEKWGKRLNEKIEWMKRHGSELGQAVCNISVKEP